MRSPEGSINNGQNKSPATTKLRGKGRRLAVAATAVLSMLGSACSDSSTASGSAESHRVKYPGFPGKSPTGWVDTDSGDHCILTPEHILGKDGGDFIVEDVLDGDRGTLCNVDDRIARKQLPAEFPEQIEQSANDYRELVNAAMIMANQNQTGGEAYLEENEWYNVIIEAGNEMGGISSPGSCIAKSVTAEVIGTVAIDGKDTIVVGKVKTDGDTYGTPCDDGSIIAVSVTENTGGTNREAESPIDTRRL